MAFGVAHVMYGGVLEIVLGWRRTPVRADALAREESDPSAVVARAALEGHSIVAERAVLLFLGA